VTRDLHERSSDGGFRRCGAHPDHRRPTTARAEYPSATTIGDDLNLGEATSEPVDDGHTSRCTSGYNNTRSETANRRYPPTTNAAVVPSNAASGAVITATAHSLR